MGRTQSEGSFYNVKMTPKSWFVSEMLTSGPFKDMMLPQSEWTVAQTEMEGTASPLLTLMFLSLSWTCNAEEDTEALTCPEYQQGFDGSCYEFVGLQRSFPSAQGWCERGGGHLAFILNDETQQFLQKHLEAQRDWWLGLAPASPNLTLDSAVTDGERMCSQCNQSRHFMNSNNQKYLYWLFVCLMAMIWLQMNIKTNRCLASA